MRAACSFLFLGLLAVVPALAEAQQAGVRDAGSALATRAQLHELLVRLERDSHSHAAAGLIRTRLDGGDFERGDRIFIRVDGEPQLTDTFTVGPGPALGLPQVDALPLAGVLRSELQQQLTHHLARFFRDPVVQARPLIRLLVEGDVAKPGFYAIPPELPLADAITVAGGLTARAKASNMRVDRGSIEIWGGEPLREAVSRGYSLDQLNLRAGDRLFVPARGDGFPALQILGLLVTSAAAVYTFTRIR
jgi:hypothetical protein